MKHLKIKIKIKEGLKLVAQNGVLAINHASHLISTQNKKIEMKCLVVSITKLSLIT